jgi:hypothetical protein
MTDWRERLNAAESLRSDNSAYWAKAIPVLMRDQLAPAAEEFSTAVGAHVTARHQAKPAENKVALSFDDWHLGEWTMTVQLIPTTLEHAWIEIACPGASPVRHALARDLPNPREQILTWMTEAYLERIGHSSS